MMYEHNGTDFIMNLIPSNKKLEVLDIGCGYGYWGYILRVNLDIDPYIIGLELNPDNVKRLQRINVYNQIILCDAVEYIDDIFTKCDLVIMSHFIEHISYEDGVRILNRIKKSCDMIVIVCPNGDALETSDIVGASHISIWNKPKSDELGFKSLCLPHSYRAGRVVSLFEWVYFRLKGKNRYGDLISWWVNNGKV